MGIFFKGERRPRPAPVDPPTVEEAEAALGALADGKSTTLVGGILRSHDLAERLHGECRRAEAALIAAVASGSVTTKVQAVACVQEATVAVFPAAKFINVIIANCGGTWAQALAAAQQETGS